MSVRLPIDTSEPASRSLRAAAPAPDKPDAFSPYERAVLDRLDRQNALADDLLWYVRGVWSVTFFPVIAGACLAAVFALVALLARASGH